MIRNHIHAAVSVRKKVLAFCFFVMVLLVCWNCLLTDRILTGYQIRSGDVPDRQIQSELKVFPLAIHSNDELEGVSGTCTYEDSWQSERTYGGNRKHEGTDLMTVRNERGMYPVVSMTDGIVEQMGWLKLGGWRIGIRGASGTYYYYAHLESYAPNLKAEMTVRAGQFLGFAGDSGYGTEGTTGQFAVHLHVGIYVPGSQGDTAINPYPYLKQLEQHRVYADYP